MLILSQLQEHFLIKFLLLTPKQQKIWKALHWFSKKFRAAFPSHAKIAEIAGVCRDTVIETIKKFKEWGWVGYLSRPYRSNLYFIPEELIALNLSNQKIFARPITSEQAAEKEQDPEPTIKSEIKHLEEDNLAPIVKELPIANEDKWKLAKWFNPQILALAIEDWKAYATEFHVHNIAAFLVNCCKKRLGQKEANNASLQNPTQDPTLKGLSNRFSYERYTTCESENVQNKKFQKTQKLPYEVKNLPIPQEDKFKIATWFSPRVIALAIEDWKSYALKFRVRNLAAFLVNRCKDYKKRYENSKELNLAS